MEDFKPAANGVATDLEHNEHQDSHHEHNQGYHGGSHHVPQYQPESVQPIQVSIVEPVVSQGVPVAAQAAFVPATPKKPRFWNRSFAYLPEYFIMLVLLATVVSSLTALVGVGIDSLVNSEKNSAASSLSAYVDNFSSFQLVVSLSALAVALPLFLLLFARTKGSESQAPGVRSHKWRKGFLGAFLIVEALGLIWTLSDMAYDLIGRMINSDSGLFSYFSGGGGKDPWWQVVLVTVIDVALILYVIFVLSRDYRQDTEV